MTGLSVAGGVDLTTAKSVGSLTSALKKLFCYAKGSAVDAISSSNVISLYCTRGVG